MSTGTPLTSDLTDGGSSNVRRCAFAGLPGCCPCLFPERGGSIETLQSFLNLSGRDDFVLIVAWLLAALRSGGPYPLLAISGEQGSAKTVLSKLLKALIDPNAAPARALSREERELMMRPTTAMSSPSTTCPACLAGSPMPSAGSQPAAASLSANSTPTMKRCCSPQRARSC